MRRRRNVAPLLAAAAAFPWIEAAVATALIGLGLWSQEERDSAEEAAYEEYRATLQPPTRPPAPPAPQTREELTTWTPADLERRAAEAWRDWRGQAIPETPTKPSTPDPWVLVGAGAAVVGLILALRS